MADVIQPKRIVQNHHVDSTNWELVEMRDGDLVVCNWAKSGITWVQQIVCQLVFDGREDVALIDHSLWPEWQTVAKEDAAAWCASVTHRRIFKSHLPADALPLSPLARYIYVARDPRDVVWSLHPHHANTSDALYASINNSPKLVGPRFEPPDPDIRSYYRTWIEKDGAPYWPFWTHIQSWWDVRHLPNVMLIHFDELKADLEAQISRIAGFIDADPDPRLWPAIVEHCGFAWMKAHTASLVSDTAFRDQSRFVNKGTNGRWRDVLSDEEAWLAEDAARRNLSEDCRAWLMGSGSS
ncbi:MAG: sulfotransferase domain-containing protein [Sphingomonadales bacterium]